MLILLNIVAPVFVLIAAGYVAVRSGYLPEPTADVLMRFTQTVAIPCLLFLAIARLDLAATFRPDLLISYYGAATLTFVLGALIARAAFHRRPGEAVAVGFCSLFANSVLLSLPIMERAFGTAALAPVYAIVAINAPFCYTLGITTMEITRADGRGALQTTLTVLRAIFSNALMIALALGFAVNLTGLWPPDFLINAAELLSRAALPAALFGLGAVLVRYPLSHNLPEVGMSTTLSLVVRPIAALIIATQVFDMPRLFVIAAVLTAAMPAGINAFVFANMYDRAKGTAAASIFIGTILGVGTISLWLALLGQP